MFTPYCLLRRLSALVLLAVSSLTAFAQIGIGGIADKTVYVDQITFTVTNQAGYAFDARLDGVSVSVGTPVLVKTVDYHELLVLRTNTTTLAVTNRLVRFIIRASERASTEVGIPVWVPYPPVPSANGEFAGASLRILAPQSFPPGMQIPVVAWVENSSSNAIRVNGTVAAAGQVPFKLSRGVGSGFLSGTNAAGTLLYQPVVGGIATSKAITIETNTVWTAIGGTLSGTIDWPANSRIALTNHVVLSSGTTLTIGAGSIVRVNPGVDITNNAAVIINGTWDHPVVFTPISPNQPWGGFIMRTNTGNITGTGVIFTGSGAVANWFGSGGNPGSHRREQSLFFCAGTNSITLKDSAAISLAGQLGHAVAGGTFTFDRFLMQRTTTGGEFTGASFRVNNSAFIECPDDSVNFVDGDNDALYLWSGNHQFTNSLFGFTKDDGIDSGGDGSGTLNYYDCWFESAFHEGNSLSGTGKLANHHRSVFINCGQAIETGYDGPTGNLFHCLATANLVGARFGDNYTTYTYGGFLRATNSLLIYNDRDVWGMTWNDWAYRTAQMEVQSNLLTVADPVWPANNVWNPASDAAQLADFLNLPLESPVGVGFALRTNCLSARALTNGLPVRLSRFSTNTVSVNYTAESPSGELASGTLVFQPGETVKVLNLSIANPENYELLSVRLSSPQQAEITGIPQVFTVGTNSTEVPTTLIPFGATWSYLDTGANLGTAWIEPEFDASEWSNGPAPLGYNPGASNSGFATVLSFGISEANKYRTTYFRMAFPMDSLAALTNLFLEVRRDDGVALYLNGQDFYRNNLPDGTLAYTHFATNATDNGGAIQSATLALTGLINGTNVLAAEVHQTSAGSSDLLFDLQLTANPVPPPALLNTMRLGADMVLYWSDATYQLEEAPVLSGPWTPSITTSTVHPVSPTESSRFYRLKQ